MSKWIITEKKNNKTGESVIRTTRKELYQGRGWYGKKHIKY